MGKGKQHNKLYITAKEYAEGFGGKEAEKAKLERPLPFYCCSLSLQPFEDPVITPDGTVYDVINIVQWLKKYKLDPRTGKKLTPKELIPLRFYKNADDKFHCPVTKKEFTENSHIVAIRTTGNVYSYDAVKQSNIIPKLWKDLMTGEDFTKDDILEIQNPQEMDRRKAAHFYFIKEGLALGSDKGDDAMKNISTNSITRKVFDELKEKERVEAEAIEKNPELKEKKEREKEYMITKPSGFVATDSSASFTSSSFNSASKKLSQLMIAKKTKKKGYVSLVTNMGNLNLELRCDIAPLASENFLTHCERGYYNNTIFHRSIKNFMLQGGDPQGTGFGGNSIWNQKFPDEFSTELKHSEPGILSMANSGRNTNGSQFFITYRATKHLDGKHTVFGRLVGGMDVLKAMEKVATDEKDKPVEDIKILETQIYLNPFSAEEMQKEADEAKAKAKHQGEKEERGQWYSNPSGREQTANEGAAPRFGVGKYLANATAATDTQNPKKRTLDFSSIGAASSTASKKAKPTAYGDFSNF